MAAIVNGLSLSKLRAFGATFFIFSDYARKAIRLSSLMELPVLHVFTHDAMSDGEDGPTHQPVEHLASLRAIPGLVVLRPADANEVVEAYRYIVQLRHKPAVIALSRHALPTLDRERYGSAAGVAQGAYILGDAPGKQPEIILIASGSEVSLALEAHETLLVNGIRSRVVSMPSWEIFPGSVAGISRECIAIEDYRKDRGGAGVNVRLGTIRWNVWSQDWNEDIWSFSAAQGTPKEIRLRSGTHCRGGSRTPGQAAVIDKSRFSLRTFA